MIERQKSLRAAIYLRVSSDKQDEHGTSLESQEENCIKRCLEDGNTVNPKLIYSEVFTGMLYRERKILAELREEVRKHSFDILYIHSLDRYSRIDAHLHILMEELEHNKIQLVSVTEDIDNTLQGRIIRSTMGIVGEVEHGKLMERTERGRAKKVSNGNLIGGGIALFGYMWNKEHTVYLINEEEAKVIRYIFQMCADGMTLRGIAGRLRREGVLNRAGKAIWHTSSMRRILSNTFYIGKAYAFQYQTIHEPGERIRKIHRPQEEQVLLPDGVVPAIVEEELFVEAQKVLERNRRDTARNNKDFKAGLLRCGFIRCGYCNSAMVMRSRRGGKKHVNPNYICPKGTSGFGECKRPCISIEVIDPIVWQRVSEWIELLAKNISWVDDQLKKMQKQNPQVVELPPIVNKLAKLNTTIKNLIAMSERDLDEDTLEGINSQLEAASKQKRELLLQQEQVTTMQVRWEEVSEKLTWFRNWCVQTEGDVTKATYEEKRVALDILGVKVQLWQKDHAPRYYIEVSPPTIYSIKERHIESQTVWKLPKLR